MWKKDKKHLSKDTLEEFQETLYEPFRSIVWATFDVLVFLRKLKICGRYTTWNYFRVTMELLIKFISKTSTSNGAFLIYDDKSHCINFLSCKWHKC